MMTSICKRDLDNAVDALGWEGTFRHLADKAREEQMSGLVPYLRLMADVLECDRQLRDALSDDERNIAANAAEWAGEQAEEGIL